MTFYFSKDVFIVWKGKCFTDSDEDMSSFFFDELNIPKRAVNLGVVPAAMLRQVPKS